MPTETSQHMFTNRFILLDNYSMKLVVAMIDMLLSLQATRMCHRPIGGDAVWLLTNKRHSGHGGHTLQKRKGHTKKNGLLPCTEHS